MRCRRRLQVNEAGRRQYRKPLHNLRAQLGIVLKLRGAGRLGSFVPSTLASSSQHTSKPVYSKIDVRFSNRPFEVQHFQPIRRSSVDVAHGLVLLFGMGTRPFHRGRP